VAETLVLTGAPAEPDRAPPRIRLPLTEPPLARAILIGVALVFLCFFLVLPLVVVFAEAFREGMRVYFAALSEPEALAAFV
jgi:sulfate transport system permease protein